MSSTSTRPVPARSCPGPAGERHLDLVDRMGRPVIKNKAVRQLLIAGRSMGP